MMSAMNALEYYEPQEVGDAIRLLSEHGEQARLLAGGTDLLIQMEGRRLQPRAVIYCARIPDLRGITWSQEGGLRVGAAATLREVENHPAIVDRYPALARGAKEVGSVQIRNLATLAGNLCNASPSADTSPALLAYDCEVEIAGPGGTRCVPVAEFWTGPGRTVLARGEMVVAMRLPPPPAGLRSFYHKLAVRKAMDLAMVGVTVTLWPGNGAARQVRIALGAVAPVCLRAAEAETAIAGGGAAAIEQAADLAEAAASPIDDHRASAAYRRAMVRVLTRRGLRHVFGLR